MAERAQVYIENEPDLFPSLTVKARRLPLIQAFYGLFDCAKCSYILLLFCLGCPNDFPHINI